MDQVAYTSPPAFLKGTKDDKVTYTDLKPWEFPTLRSEIQRIVLEEVQKKAEDREILNTVRDFTLLQRFFRAVLAGKVGEHFPLDRLVALADAVKPAPGTNHARTHRWNVRQSPANLEVALAGQLSRAVSAVETQLKADGREDILGKPDDALKALRACRDRLKERAVSAESSLKEESDLKSKAPKAGPASAPDWERRWSQLWRDRETAQEKWTKADDPTLDLLKFSLFDGDDKPKPPWPERSVKSLRAAMNVAVIAEEELRLRYLLGILADERQLIERDLFKLGLPKIP
jgi:hypothetical protein